MSGPDPKAANPNPNGGDATPIATAGPVTVPHTAPVSAVNSFAQAQQRLAARRQAREAEAAARVAAQQSASRLRARVAAAQPPLVRRLGASTLSLWDALARGEGTRPAFRVGQVDAELLDEELVGLLRGQVGEALRYFNAGAPPGIHAGGTGGGGGGGNNALLHDWDAEISLALRAVLFKLTVWDHDATYGAALQNLRYTDARRAGPAPAPPTRWQKSLYGLATVGGRYLWAKWEDWLVAQDDGFEGPGPRVRRLSRWTSRLSTLHAAAAFASFLVFLVHGRYRTLLDRVLRMRLAPPTSQVSREVSFEYLNRQLVWHAFTEFLLFVLPLVGINRWRRWLARAWRRTKKMMTTGSAGAGDESKGGEFAFLPERTCAICYQEQNSAANETELMAPASGGVVGSAQTDITNPYEAIPCGCVYCFVCLATRIESEEGEGWSCLRCGELVKECRPWAGDVLEEPEAKSPAPKTVVFADEVRVRPDHGDGEGSQVPVEEDDAGRSLEELRRPPTPGAASDGGGGGSDGSESEDYEAEEVELGEDTI